MAYTISIPLGAPTILQMGVEYALPARAVNVMSSVAVEVSVNGVAWKALTNADVLGAVTSAQMIRCTTGSPTVLCKPT